MGFGCSRQCEYVSLYFFFGVAIDIHLVDENVALFKLVRVVVLCTKSVESLWNRRSKLTGAVNGTQQWKTLQNRRRLLSAVCVCVFA